MMQSNFVLKVKEVVTKKHYGSKAQALWQTSIGTSIAIIFVAIPTYVEYLKAKREEIARDVNRDNLSKSVGNDSIQKLVYNERLAMRKNL